MVNTGVGLGDGVIAALTWGRVSGQDIRDLIPYTQGINGGADECSAAYQVSYLLGAADAIGAEGGSFAAQARKFQNAAQATYLSLQPITGASEIAQTWSEISSSMAQLESIVEMQQEAAAERSVIPPPGFHRY